LTFLLLSCGSQDQQGETQATSTPAADSSLVIVEGRIEPVRYTELAMDAGGLVSEVLVPEGAEVSAGDVIARLESSEVQSLADALATAASELTSAHEALRDAQFDLDNFDIPIEYSSLTPDKAALQTLDLLDQARDAFEPFKNLGEKRLELSDAEKKQDTFETYNDKAKLYKHRLDNAWADHRKVILWLELDSNLKAAQARLDKAQREFDGLQDPTYAESTAGVRSALANAELRVPFSGTLTRLDLHVGEFNTPGTQVATIADLSTWVVKTTDLTELDVVSIHVGQAATVTMDALPDIRLAGIVDSIGQYFEEKQGDIVYEVTLKLTDTDPAMRWGMTVDVEFED
jgi:HlyD family secretion protein